MSEEKKPYLIINEECDEIKINIKHTKPYIKLQQENQQLKEIIEELKKELEHIDKDIMETCKSYDVNGIKIKQILDKAKENK